MCLLSCFRRITENRNTGCSGIVILPVTFIQAPCITARVILLLQANDEYSEWTEHITYNIQVQFFFNFGTGWRGRYSDPLRFGLSGDRFGKGATI